MIVRINESKMHKKINFTWKQVKRGCWRSLAHRKQSTSRADWGNDIGAFWMFCYWILEPFWLLYVAYTYSLHLQTI